MIRGLNLITVILQPKSRRCSSIKAAKRSILRAMTMSGCLSTASFSSTSAACTQKLKVRIAYLQRPRAVPIRKMVVTSVVNMTAVTAFTKAACTNSRSSMPNAPLQVPISNSPSTASSIQVPFRAAAPAVTESSPAAKNAISRITQTTTSLRISAA